MFGPHWTDFAEHVKRNQEMQHEVPWRGEMDSWPQKDLIDHIDRAISEFLGEPSDQNPDQSEGC